MTATPEAPFTPEDAAALREITALVGGAGGRVEQSVSDSTIDAAFAAGCSQNICGIPVRNAVYGDWMVWDHFGCEIMSGMPCADMVDSVGAAMMVLYVITRPVDRTMRNWSKEKFAEEVFAFANTVPLTDNPLKLAPACCAYINDITQARVNAEPPKNEGDKKGPPGNG